MPPEDRRRILIELVLASTFVLAALVCAVVVGDASIGAVASLAAGITTGVSGYVSRERLTEIRGIFGAGIRRCLRGCAAQRQKVPGGRLVRVAAVLMAPRARRRWLEDIEVTLYDFAPEQHQALMRDFLWHAPVVVIVGWAAWAGQLPRELVGIDRRPFGSS